MLLAVLELSVVLFLSWFIITQFIIPLLKGLLVLPIFRKEAKLHDELAATKQKVVEKNIKTEIKTIKEKEGV